MTAALRVSVAAEHRQDLVSNAGTSPSKNCVAAWLTPPTAPHAPGVRAKPQGVRLLRPHTFRPTERTELVALQDYESEAAGQ